MLRKRLLKTGHQQELLYDRDVGEKTCHEKWKGVTSKARDEKESPRGSQQKRHEQI